MTRALPQPLELNAFGLRLRPWRSSDLDAAAQGIADPEFIRWNTRNGPKADKEGALLYIQRRAEQWASGQQASFAVTTPNDKVLGSVGVGALDRFMGRGIIGYWVLPEARRHLVASRAVEAMTRWAFSALGLHRIELGHEPANEASCRVAQRCGFQYEGLLRGALPHADGSHRDIHMHGRLATDPAPAGFAD